MQYVVWSVTSRDSDEANFKVLWISRSEQNDKYNSYLQLFERICVNCRHYIIAQGFMVPNYAHLPPVTVALLTFLNSEKD